MLCWYFFFLFIFVVGACVFCALPRKHFMYDANDHAEPDEQNTLKGKKHAEKCEFDVVVPAY